MKITIEGYLYRVDYEWDDVPRYYIENSKTMGEANPDWALIKPVQVEVDIPDNFDPKPAKIANLRSAKEKILAEAHVQAENIEEQIQRLLCLEHKR